MEPPVSVSKGVFVYKNGIKAAPARRKRRQTESGDVMISDSLWYTTYRSLWTNVDTKIRDLNNQMFSNVLSNLVQYVKNSYKNPVTEIPSAALLTGINMPDHMAQFKSLSYEIRQKVTPHVVNVTSEDCQNLKCLVETMTNQLVQTKTDVIDEEDSDDDACFKVKKSQCSFSYLQNWYEDTYQSPTFEGSPSKKRKTKDARQPIVVILSDFETFTESILQDFILIASSYINILPFVLIFGVATSVTVLHKSLPYHVSSKVNIEVFNSSPSTMCLNNVLENVLLSPDCPFHLGGKVFNLFTDIFLFYDLSVSGFVKNFKYAMLEHFSCGNIMALCGDNNYKEVLVKLDHGDLETVRRLPSFKEFLKNEPTDNQIQLLADDECLRKTVRKQIKKIRTYLGTFHLFLKCLYILVSDLPKNPLGKQLREIYSVAVSRDITETQEYKECFQLLGFQSKDELHRKLSKIADLLSNNIGSGRDDFVADYLKSFLEQLDSLQCDMSAEEQDDPENENVFDEVVDRIKLKMKLLEISKRRKPMNKYEKIRARILEFLSEAFSIYLPEPKSFCLHEIFFFNDISIQHQIVGCHRAAIHSALSDPHFYLQCSCCRIPDDSVIRPTMPDISIAYKLHLECGKLINLYDWLQAFLSILDPQMDGDSSKRVVKPELQARFTQAVAELEYLGFVKSSKRKTDHVSRLTWGG